ELRIIALLRLWMPRGDADCESLGAQMTQDPAPQKACPAEHGHDPRVRAHFAMEAAGRVRRRPGTGRMPDRNRVARGKRHLDRLIELSLALFGIALFRDFGHEPP